MKKLWDFYRNTPWERKILITAFTLSLLPIGLGILFKSISAPAEDHGGSRHAEVDTYIPKGFVLVPIEVQNYEALDSILGQFGVVDLFQATGPDHSQSRLVARNVRILRAPLNPSHFAVLVQEEGVANVLKNGGVFTVIMKRPEKAGTELVNGDPPLRRSIVYERE